MKNFQEIYLHMLYEHAGFISFDLKIYEDFLKGIVKFDNSGLLLEDKKLLVDIPDETIIYLLKGKAGIYLSGNEFIQTFKASRHWRNIKNISIDKIYFKIFDFENDQEIDSFNYSIFKINDNKDLISARIMFKKNIQTTYGFYINFNNLNIICINKHANNIQNVLMHELSHFLQCQCNIRIIKTKIHEKNTSKLKDIFGADLDQCLSYFSDKEFITSLNDLLMGLKEVKYKFYNDLNEIEFLMKIKSYLKDVFNTKSFEHDLFYKYIKINSGNYYPLTFLIVSYVLNYKYQYIEDKILKYFKKN